MPGSKNIILRGYQHLSISYSSQNAKNTPRRVKILPGEYFSGLSLNDTQTHIFHKNINPDTKQIGTGHFCKLGLFIFEN